MLLLKKVTGKIVEFENFQCKYRLLKNPHPSGHTSYGVSIELYSEGLMTDSCTIKDITTCKEKADHMLMLLQNGFVTPITCYEVIDNFLAVN